QHARELIGRHVCELWVGAAREAVQLLCLFQIRSPLAETGVQDERARRDPNGCLPQPPAHRNLISIVSTSRNRSAFAAVPKDAAGVTHTRPRDARCLVIRFVAELDVPSGSPKLWCLYCLRSFQRTHVVADVADLTFL